MKSIVFELDINHSKSTYILDGKSNVYTFHLPLAPAYAIEYYTIHIGSLSGFPNAENELIGNTLTLSLPYTLDDKDDCRITIFHYGIRDYSLLFPNVSPLDLKNRLGEFYREAEITFDSASWLGFALMCGALFEGILYFSLKKNNKFIDLISNARAQNIINSEEEKIINKVRDARNLVHANKHQDPYITRLDAMDIKITLDKLLNKVSN